MSTSLPIPPPVLEPPLDEEYQGEFPSADEVDEFGDVAAFGTPLLFLVYFLLVFCVMFKWCMKHRESQQRRQAVRTLIERSRMDRVHPITAGLMTSTSSHGTGRRDGQGDIDFEAEAFVLRKEILIEHFRSMKKQMVRYHALSSKA